MEMNHFVKTHGLGNEYIVLDKDNISFELDEQAIKRICNVNFGIGSDGILLKVHSDKADVGLRIYNPDGSEAEKSGNGLRIFSKYVYDYGIMQQSDFSIETQGGLVYAHVKEARSGRAYLVSVDMGRAIFASSLVPTKIQAEVVDDYVLQVDDREYLVSCVSVGNPHCVILKDDLDIEEIKKYGPLIESHPLFPNRINVQFVKVLSRQEVEVLIWERGAGFTLASGSSSCAVASILKRKNLVDACLRVKMLGGQLEVEVDESWNIKMTGGVRQICEGVLSNELIDDLQTA